MAEKKVKKGSSTSIDEIREILKEVGEIQRETALQMQETDRKMQETDRKMQETDRKMQETDRKMQETDRQFKKTDRRLKELNELFTNQWGKLMETLVEGDLVQLLREKGIEITWTYPNAKGPDCQIDILALNGSDVVVVEVKTTLVVDDVNEFVDKKLKRFIALKSDYQRKNIYGAVAFLKAKQSSDEYAEKQGLFVIRATGSSASIVNKELFRPRNFAPQT